jgi:hypothetical protein
MAWSLLDPSGLGEMGPGKAKRQRHWRACLDLVTRRRLAPCGNTPPRRGWTMALQGERNRLGCHPAREKRDIAGGGLCKGMVFWSWVELLA